MSSPADPGPTGTMNKRPIKKPVALVTGAGVRVGRAIAETLEKAGYTIAAHYRSSPPPRRWTAFQADLATADGADHLAVAFKKQFDHLDLLVNSAAAFEKRTLAATDAASFDRQMDLNARAPLLVTRAFARLLRRSGGSVVNIVDVGGAFVPWNGFAAYIASKAALTRLTECLALELAPKVRVNGVAPGAVLWPADYSNAQKRTLMKRIPLGRAGSPEEVARGVLFLAGADFITGAILPIDGGRHLSGLGD